MEGIDRPSAGDRAAGRRAAERARRLVAARRARCDGGGTAPALPPLAMSPAPGEAFLGPVVARAPDGATSATLTVDGGFAGTAAVRGGRVRFGVNVAPGPHDVRIAFTAGAGVTRVLISRGAVLLPGARCAPPSRPARTWASAGASTPPWPAGRGIARRGCTTSPTGARPAPGRTCASRRPRP